MVQITFADAIQRHVPCPPLTVGGDDVRSVFEAVFQENGRLRSYLLDDQGALRQHLAVFVNGQQIADPSKLTDEVPEDATVHVIQALSGG